MDTQKISSRLSSFSRALNWVCIEGQINAKAFFGMHNGPCETGIFQQNVKIDIPEANNTTISFTLKIQKDLEIIFATFFILQLGLIATLISATKKAEEEKMKNEIAISKLSRKMFHDIRSPLASLNTISASTKFQTNAEQDIFKTSINRINEIANSLLNKTKTSVVSLPSYICLDKLILEVISEKFIEYPELKIKIEYEKKVLDAVLAEPSEFKRMLSNLINNSIEAATDDVKIKIESSRQANRLELVITDNGTGIPQKIIARLGKDEMTTKANGNGIGLKDALELMQEWGGNLKIIESNKNGTTINLEFVLRDQSDQYVLIDDDPLTRLTWDTRAKKSQINLITFSTSDEFQLMKNTFSKNLFLYIDSELGTVKGEELALELHKEGFLNISITTGHSSEHFKEFSFLKSVISKASPF